MLSLATIALVFGTSLALVCPPLPNDQFPMKFNYTVLTYQGQEWCYRVRAQQVRSVTLAAGCAPNEVPVNTYEEIIGINRQFRPKLKFAWVYAEQCGTYYCTQGSTTAARSMGTEGVTVLYEEGKCLEFVWQHGRGQMVASGCGGSCPLVCRVVCPPREAMDDSGNCQCLNNLVPAAGSRSDISMATCECPDPIMTVNEDESACECPEGLYLNADGDGCECPSFQTINANGDGCDCPPGTVLNEAGDDCIFDPSNDRCNGNSLRSCVDACLGNGSQNNQPGTPSGGNPMGGSPNGTPQGSPNGGPNGNPNGNANGSPNFNTPGSPSGGNPMGGGPN